MSKPQATNGVTLPREATLQGGLNETTPPAQRAPEGAALGQGPVVDESTGAYLPATYETAVREGAGSVIRTDR